MGGDKKSKSHKRKHEDVSYETLSDASGNGITSWQRSKAKTATCVESTQLFLPSQILVKTKK